MKVRLRQWMGWTLCTVGVCLLASLVVLYSDDNALGRLSGRCSQICSTPVAACAHATGTCTGLCIIGCIDKWAAVGADPYFTTCIYGGQNNACAWETAVKCVEQDCRCDGIVGNCFKYGLTGNTEGVKTACRTAIIG